MGLSPVKRVAVIGAGPAGAIAVDALAQEQSFDLIRVFERREGPGGCWIGDTRPNPTVTNLDGLAKRTADPAVTIPSQLPASTAKVTQPRFTESSIYPYLETNVVDLSMQFSEEPIPAEPSQLSIGLYGEQTPFRPWQVMKRYVTDLFERRGYSDLVQYNTSVELVEKVGQEWKVVLRKEGDQSDYWWAEWFDAVIVANGHFSVPYIPAIDGLEAFEKSRPGSVLHSKDFRGRDLFRDKRVVVVGASVSAADIAFDLTRTAKSPVSAVILGHTANSYFGDVAFHHPKIARRPSISKVVGRTVHFIDSTFIEDVDHIIFGTGYSWSVPFLPSVPVRNNRIPGLYQHIIWREDPTLLFIGAVGAGLTFSVFEWQAVYAARLLAGRGTLPTVQEMKKWEEDRIATKGDGPKFSLIFPDFEDYFETLRRFSGEPTDGKGRRLPKFQKVWFDAFMHGHEMRKDMWKRLIEQAKPSEQAKREQESAPELARL